MVTGVRAETTKEHPMTKPHQHPAGSGHGGHGLMMMACCVPMLILAVVLVATGVFSPGFLLVAVGCTVMMALMMRGMSSTGGKDSVAHDRHEPGRRSDPPGHDHTVPR
jgi:hypothetical protein